MLFSISPWTKRTARAIHKESKLYLWEAPRINDPEARFENMVAQELLRAVIFWNDMGIGNFWRHFIKNREQLEAGSFIAEKKLLWQG